MRNYRDQTSAIAAIAIAVTAMACATLSPVAADDKPAPDPVHVDACATDPNRLGLSRVVEIDTSQGPQFGGNHTAETNFLNDHEVVLTFDDGPLKAYTRSVLKALADHCTKATFFMVGRMAAADPAMVKEVAAAGHTVASHTWSHKNLRPLGLIKGRQEFENGVSAVTKALGRPIAPFFRFPYLAGGRIVEDYIKSRHVSSIWIDVDSKDYQTRDPKVVFDRIMAQLNVLHKGIILMHDIQPSTAKNIMPLLNALRDKGYKVVHIVPKSTLDTIAAFDINADKAIAAKAAASSADPLASRSMVWTMAPAGEDTAGTTTGSTTVTEKPAPAKKPRSTSAAKRTSATKSASTEEVLPWSSPEVTPTADPANPRVKARPTTKPDDDKPWSIFGN